MTMLLRLLLGIVLGVGLGVQMAVAGAMVVDGLALPVVVVSGADPTGVVDSTNAIQSAINTVATLGGVVVIPPGTYLVSDTAPIDGVALLIGQHAGVTLAGSGQNATKLLYAGTTAIDVIRSGPAIGTTPIATHIQDLQISFSANNHNSVGVHLIDPVYSTIQNVTVGSTASGAGLAKVIGVWLDVQTANLVPPAAATEIENYLFTQLAGTAGVGSRGIKMTGGVSKVLGNTALLGWGDIEDAEIGIEWNTVTASTLGPSKWFLNGNITGLSLIGAQNNVVYGVQFNNQATTNIAIDNASFDNAMLFNSFFNPATFGTDSGVRTLHLGGGSTGFDTTVIPGGITIATAVSAGTGMQHVRTAGCTTGAVQFNTCTTAVTWTPNFASTAYSVVCTCETPTAHPLLSVTAKAIGSATVTTETETAAAASCATIDCVALHD